MSELIFESNQEESEVSGCWGVMSIYDYGTTLAFDCHMDYGAKLPAEDVRAMHESLGVWLKEKPETWQQMAERLGVEVLENRTWALSDRIHGRQIRLGKSCCEISVYRWKKGAQLFGEPKIETHNEYGDAATLNSPQQARDLSACLQVAARYLEEVRGE